jgi:hypothetical protein
MISTCAAAGHFESCNIKLEKAEESGRKRGLSTCKALGSDILEEEEEAHVVTGKRWRCRRSKQLHAKSCSTSTDVVN